MMIDKVPCPGGVLPDGAFCCLTFDRAIPYNESPTVRMGDFYMSKSKNAKRFGTRWGFILASVGSAVGMANVWGFPNKMGQNGGGAFC